jgi:hypothetical protein
MPLQRWHGNDFTEMNRIVPLVILDIHPVDRVCEDEKAIVPHCHDSPGCEFDKCLGKAVGIWSAAIFH